MDREIIIKISFESQSSQISSSSYWQFFNSVLFFKFYIGDEFALRDGNSLFCKMDNDALDKLAQSELDSSGIEFRDGNNQITTNSTGSNNNSSEFGSMSGKLRYH
jgi:hypothetical protein